MSTKIKYGTRELAKDFGEMTFAKALIAERLSEEMSQKDFAKKLKISPQSLCDLERSRKIPTAERAARIAKILKEPIPYWVKLAIQDSLRSQNLNFDVELAERNEAA